jgi:transposase
MPKQAGDRVNTERRDAVPRARWMRAGDRTPVAVPQVADAAMRALSRARADPRRALKAAPCRLNACLLRQDSRSPGQATGGPAPLRWRADVVCATPAPPSVFPA